MRNIFLLIFMVFFFGCERNKVLTTNGENALKPVVIYKTTMDYSKNIPIVMDEAKEKIIAYPAITDVSNSKRPTRLANGFLLDNFGVQKNTVYTSYTIEEFQKLNKQPSLNEFEAKIIDKNPFVEMYRYMGSTSTIEGLNQEIINGFNNSNKIIKR